MPIRFRNDSLRRSSARHAPVVEKSRKKPFSARQTAEFREVSTGSAGKPVFAPHSKP